MRMAANVRRYPGASYVDTPKGKGQVPESKLENRNLKLAAQPSNFEFGFSLTRETCLGRVKQLERRRRNRPYFDVWNDVIENKTT